MNPARQRLDEDGARRRHWKRWGPYLSDRAWGTVREDYSAHGTAWDYFPHDHARSRAYRWNEDGLLGISDRHQKICFGLALWNGRDPILKERLFGLTGHEGNHGEDVKEYYFHLDSTPTHSYMRALYKYPQAAFPYATLVEENARRGRGAPEFELIDSGVFADDRYFDVQIEYAKADTDDLLVRVGLMPRPSGYCRPSGSGTPGRGERRLLSVVDPDRLRQVLAVMLDESEFLSSHGVRALSRRHLDEPYSLVVDGQEHRVTYEPADSSTGLFGGNSNWRGPIWFPMNFLLVESLQKFHHYLGDDFTVECPTGSGRMLTLWQVADEISGRLTSVFLRNSDAGDRCPCRRRPLTGPVPMTCRDFLDFIMGYLDGELPADVRAPFERHLSLCPDCDRYLRRYRATAEAAGPAFADPEAAVPAEVPDELVRAILASRRT